MAPCRHIQNGLFKLSKHFKQIFAVLMFLGISTLIFNYNTSNIINNIIKQDVDVTNQQQSVSLKPLFVTISSNGYIKLTKNWILNMEKHDMTDYLVICSDYECSKSLKKFTKNKADHVETSGDILNISYSVMESANQSYLHWLEPAYIKFIKSRPNVYKQLFLRYNDDFASKYNAIFIMDSDIGIHRNFISLLQTEYVYDRHNAMYDMVFVWDSWHTDCHADNHQYSGGVIFLPFINKNDMKHREKILFFLDLWSDILHAHNYNKGDQPGMNRAVNVSRNKYTDKLNIGVFNCSSFATGGAMNNEKFKKRYWDTPHPNDRPTQLIHANWMEGYEKKKKFLSQFHMWLLNE